MPMPIISVMEENDDINLVKLKNFVPPCWASIAPGGFFMSVIKEKECIQKIALDDKKFFIFGRLQGDILIQHESCSGIHAALVYHNHLCRWFIFDLSSTHGTFLGRVKIDSEKPTIVNPELPIRFGASTRSYFIRSPNEEPIPNFIIKEPIKTESLASKSKPSFKLTKKKRTGKRRGRTNVINVSNKTAEPEFFDHSLIPGDLSGRFEYMSSTYILESADSHNNRQVMLKVMNQKKNDRNRSERKSKKFSSAPEAQTPRRPDQHEPHTINFLKTLRR
uniref:Nuclear inhibitor of protein phosphatase 1 (Trinotate prediction) n=1 Tax=Myxobolus squamalis TaxID=59785 RepID=A0A6B2G103_MYXSQ